MLLFPAEYDLLDASVVLPGLVKQKSKTDTEQINCQSHLVLEEI